jgi:D-alanyl-D-alanine carboxypeptidase/D-alanyl-D-alanine-endopeptidase (penicillin-binding protein 4)
MLDVPFLTNGVRTALELLRDTLHREIGVLKGPAKGSFQWLRSRPVDSMLKPMMYRSDNFFAEQSLLMVGYKLTGAFNNDSTIKFLLANDFRDMPQKPGWVDGSGLSRYNLFTPNDLVWILDRMKKEQPWSRITGILATGGTGTLGREYQADSTRIYAKTGSLSGVGALSGYLLTRSGKTLIFSVMFNNNRLPNGPIRHRVHDFLKELMDGY